MSTSYHRYRIERNLENLPIVTRKRIQQLVDYRTKDSILELCGEMRTANDTGPPHQIRLDPPSGPRTYTEGDFAPVAQWDESYWPSHIHQSRAVTTAPRASETQ